MARPTHKPSLDLLRPVTKLSLNDVIVERLCSYISANGLLPGARLPSETEIAAALKVSRSSVREAISGMTAYGLLDRRAGDGTYVTSRISNMVIRPLALRLAIDPQTIVEIIEVRRAVEAECAFLAAERASVEDKEQIDTCLRRISEAKSPEAATQADFTFHMEIARVARNPILFDVLNYLSDLIYESHLATTRAHGGVTPSAHRYHVRIVDAIKLGEPDRARDLMRAHLKDISDDYSAHSGGGSDPDAAVIPPAPKKGQRRGRAERSGLSASRGGRRVRVGT